MKLSSAVMFVSELDRSVRFYEDLLQVTARHVTPSAALLVTPGDSQLYLRSMGDRAPHPLGALGIQYLIWTARDLDDLARCEAVFRREAAYVTRQTVDAFTIVEGVGPNGVPILVTFPGPDDVARAEIIARIYGW